MKKDEVVSRLVELGVERERAEKFVEFHVENKEIWFGFVEKALALLGKGQRRWGAKAIFEVLRYETAIGAKSRQQAADAHKLNNNLTSLYARLWAVKYPHFADFFETRESNELTK